MRISLAEMNDISAVRSLWDICFGDSTDYTDIFFTKMYQSARTVVARIEAEIIGSLQFFPHTMFSQGKPLSAMYIGGVDVFPSHRGKGVAKELMAYTEEYLRENGTDVLFLTPVFARIYERMGFKPLSYLSEVSGPMSALSSFSAYSVSFSPTDCPMKSYEKFIKQFPLSLKRTKETFSQEIFPLSKANCCASENGYILFTIKDNLFQGLECGYKNADALRQILGFIYTNFNEVENFSICVPADGLTRMILPETTVMEKRFIHTMAKPLTAQVLTERMENYINMIGWF